MPAVEYPNKQSSCYTVKQIRRKDMSRGKGRTRERRREERGGNKYMCCIENKHFAFLSVANRNENAIFKKLISLHVL